MNLNKIELAIFIGVWITTTANVAYYTLAVMNNGWLK